MAVVTGVPYQLRGAEWVAPGRGALPAKSSFNPTSDVYPTLATHPAASFVRSGGLLTSSGRNPLPVWDNPDGFTLGSTRPTWANSGCRYALGELERNETINLITTSHGQVIEGLHLPYGRIEIRHRNVTIRNCHINIGWAPSGAGPGQRLLIQNNVAVACNRAYDTTGWRLEYVTVDPINAGGGSPAPAGETVHCYNLASDGVTWQWSVVPNGQVDDAQVSGFFMLGAGYAYRCAVRNVTDAFMPDYQWGYATPSGAAHIWGSYLQTRWLSYDSQQKDGTHNDGVQFTGADGDTVIGNAIVCPPGNVTEPNTGRKTQGQCIVQTPYHGSDSTRDGTKDSAQSSNTYIAKNWLSGSYSQIAAWAPYSEGGPGMPGMTIVDNRHGGKCEWAILLMPATNATLRKMSGNVADAGGLTRNGGTTAPGSTVPVNVATRTEGPSSQGAANTSHAGNDQRVEPGTRVFLLGKGRGAGASDWIKTGTWTQTGGPAVTLTTRTVWDGTADVTYAFFDAPISELPQDFTFQYQATGLASTDSTTITVAPNQN